MDIKAEKTILDRTAGKVVRHKDNTADQRSIEFAVGADSRL
jgi:hypothetical protein